MGSKWETKDGMDQVFVASAQQREGEREREGSIIMTKDCETLSNERSEDFQNKTKLN